MHAGLDDCTILITGAAGGIGSATAHEFAAAGARLALHYHRSARAAHALATALDERWNTESIVVDGDLGNPTEAETVMARVADRFGTVDALVVNHGTWVASPTPLVDMEVDQWRATLRVNLDSAFYCCRAFLRHLRAKPRDHASIVLVGSTAGLFGEADHADYAAAKSALTQGLLLSLKNEIPRLAPSGRINAVCPGWTATPMAAAALADPDVVARATATMPLRRVAAPEDVARAVVWLSSPTLARHLTGVVLPVAGGMEGRLLHPPSASTSDPGPPPSP